MLLGLNVVVVLKTVLGQQLLHLLVRTRRNLVDHRPGEGHLLLILQVGEEGSGHQSVVHPALGIGKDTCLHLVAIVRTVVHRLHGEGQLACVEALQQQGADLTHSKHGLQSASQVGLVIGVSLLGNGEGNHLQ